MFVRLGEVQVQREDWPAAITAVQRGVDKGQLKDPGNAQLMLGIAHYSQKELRGGAAVLRARSAVREASADRGQLPAGHPGTGLIAFF